MTQPLPVRTTRFIPEIQGLRTIALLLVVAYHLWFGRVSGGVDVFLMVSAFLMTRSIVVKHEGGARFNPIAFSVTKFARLWPLAAVVAAATLLLLLVFLPQSRWQGEIGHGIASAFYFENFQLQWSQVDYNANVATTATPFQQYWSLSIQGQVFLIWALVHWLAVLASGNRRENLRAVLIGVFAVVFAASLAYSVWLTGVNQPHAYFDTWARLWEFAAGSLLGLIPALRLPTWLRIVFGWTGLVALIACGFVLPVSSIFPSFIALWPITSAALVILAAGEPTKFGADRLLANGAVRGFGNITYALYLVHWPVMIFVQTALNIERVDGFLGTAILLGSIVISWMLTYLFDVPLRRWAKSQWQRASGRHVAAPKPNSPRGLLRPATVVVLSIALVLSAATVSRIVWQRHHEETLAQFNAIDYSTLGANAPYEPGIDEDAIGQEESGAVNGGYACAEGNPAEGIRCLVMPTSTGKSPKRKVFVWGNSHALQTTGTLQQLVGRHPDWELRLYYVSRCGWGMTNAETTGCGDLPQAAADYIREQQPDLVVIVGTRSAIDGNDRLHYDQLDWLGELKQHSPGTEFVVLRDTPRFPNSPSPFRCGELHGFGAPGCTRKYQGVDLSDYQAYAQQRGLHWVDLNASVCPNGECPTALGGVVTYYDDNHLTAAFQATLTQRFVDQLPESIEWIPRDAYAGEYRPRLPQEMGDPLGS